MQAPNSFEEQQAITAGLRLVATCLMCTYCTKQIFQAKKAEENLVLQTAMLVMDSIQAELLSVTEANALLRVLRDRNKGIQENGKV